MILRITVTIIMIFLAIFANIIVLRRIGSYVVEVNFYDKLSVAYDIGGAGGLRSELARIKTHDKLKRESALAAEFEKRLANLKEPEAFIDNALAENRKKIKFLISLRNAAMMLILAVFILRAVVDLKLRRNKQG